MIEIQKIKIIEDEKMRAEVESIICERELYYQELFSGGTLPRIVIRFENLAPFRARIIFHPRGEKPVMIDVESYSLPDVAVKHGFKKLRRTAKNYYIKRKNNNKHRAKI